MSFLETFWKSTIQIEPLPRHIRFQIPSFQTNFHSQLLHPLLRPHHRIDDFRDGFHGALLALGHRGRQIRARPESAEFEPRASRIQRRILTVSSDSKIWRMELGSWLWNEISMDFYIDFYGSYFLGKPGFWWPRLTHLAPWYQKSHVNICFAAENWWELWFSSHVWKKIHCDLKSSKSKPAANIWLKPSNLLQLWIFPEESGSSVASSASQGISNRKSPNLPCCESLITQIGHGEFDINNSGLIDFIPLLWGV